MSELTERVQKMLSQAQGFVRDAPFEAVSRVRLAVKVVDAALATSSEQERPGLLALRKVAAQRVEKYEARLASWLAEASSRSALYTSHEQAHLAQPMLAVKV